MSRKRTPIFTAVTPYDRTPQVTLLEETWQGHIVAGHVEMENRQPTVKGILEKPVAVVDGTNQAGNIVFIGDEKSAAGSPIVVCVNPTEQIVVTAGYNRKFKSLKGHTVLWPK